MLYTDYKHCFLGTVLDYLPYNFVADGEQTEMKPMRNFPFLKLLALGKALREAREERREARDRGERPLVDGVRRDFEANLRVGAKARQERRHERRGR